MHQLIFKFWNHSWFTLKYSWKLFYNPTKINARTVWNSNSASSTHLTAAYVGAISLDHWITTVRRGFMACVRQSTPRGALRPVILVSKQWIKLKCMIVICQEKLLVSVCDQLTMSRTFQFPKCSHCCCWITLICSLCSQSGNSRYLHWLRAGFLRIRNILYWSGGYQKRVKGL